MLGDTKKPPCIYCGGPEGECIELRGGCLPERVCKKRLTYRQLWEKCNELIGEVGFFTEHHAKRHMNSGIDGSTMPTYEELEKLWNKTADMADSFLADKLKLEEQVRALKLHNKGLFGTQEKAIAKLQEVRESYKKLEKRLKNTEKEKQ